MSSDAWLALSLTIGLVALAPGPSVTLVWVQQARFGRQATWPTIAGDLSANMLQLLVAWAGLTELREMGVAQVVLAWTGAGYIGYLGVRQVFGSAHPAAAGRERAGPGGPSPRACYARGFLVSAANPKAIVFFMSLLPSAIAGTEGTIRQLGIVALTFVALDGSALMLYALWGDRMHAWLVRHGRVRWERRIAGGLLLAAAVILASRV